jgi:DNA-binding response OmpR family regulator
MVEDFLTQALDQLSQMNAELDLAINLIRTTSLDSFYLEPFHLSDLVSDLKDRVVNQDLFVVYQDPEPNLDLPLQVDPNLTILALSYLMEEVAQRSPTGQPIELSISFYESFIELSFRGSRNLPLPGWDFDNPEVAVNNLTSRFFIAQRIITAIDGVIKATSSSGNPDAGLTIITQLPISEQSDLISETLTKSKLVEITSGRVLLAEDQAEYLTMINAALSEEGFRVDLAREGSAALDIVQRINPDAVIISRNLPGLDGLLLTQAIRRWSTVPIFMISLRNKPDDLIQAFQAGVDDYLTKPFLMNEFILRLNALLKRSQSSREEILPEIYHSGVIRINYSTQQVWISGKKVNLTPLEYSLLEYMSRQGRQILTYEQLLNQVWAGPEKGTRQGLFVHIRRLREKIETDPKNPQLIKNKWGVGYMFNP